MTKPLQIAVGAALALALAACAHARAPHAIKTYDPAALPAGPLGGEIRYGRELIMQTREAMPHNVGARMECAACHIAGGTQPHGGSFAGVYATFPQWNGRAHRLITLQDRIAECFLYSMNGRPPAYSSREMIAIVAYIAWLSRGSPVLATNVKPRGFRIPLPKGAPDATAGSKLFSARCALCHGAAGAGGGPFPPLWGSGSFNNGAGMSHLNRMTGFVYYNMPQNAPHTLTVQEAYDVSGFVLSHARPSFRKQATIEFPALRAGYF
ncbi:MAG: c-type cytochrome [Candidatus Tyrphobacter sp.]